MFCPLCRTEYRDGFSQCADCHLGLVGSLNEAQSSSVKLWEGSLQRTLDKVLAALDAEAIPAHFEETVSSAPRVTLLGIPVTRIKSTFEYEVWVLASDLDRARLAIADISPDWFSAVLDELNWQAIARRVGRAFGGSSRRHS